MPFGSLSNVLELKHAEGFRGSSVLQQSYPLTGYTTAAAAPAAFTPLSLFASGEQGAWYDPSDLTTMFEDSAGTTPVHTPGNGVADSPVGKILDKSGRGNHATQSTGTARPTLSAKYNLLTYTEAFNNAAWTRNDGTLTADTTTAPDGTTTADTWAAIAGNSQHNLQATNPITSVVGVNYTLSFALKYNNNQWIAVAIADSGWKMALFDVQNGVVGTAKTSGMTSSITSIGSGWYRCTVTWTAVSTSLYAGLFIKGSDVVGNNTNLAGGEAVYIWGADLRVSNDGVGLPAYQRVVNADTYDSTGFPYYLVFDGVNKALFTTGFAWGSSKVSSFLGARLFVTGAKAVYEFGDNSSANTFGLILNPNCPNFISWGSTNQGAQSSIVTAVPKTEIISGLADVAAPVVLLRENGTQTAINTSSQGTVGNYGTNSLYLGARLGSSYPWNGRMYGLIARSAYCTSTEITNAETWMNGKTKAY